MIKLPEAAVIADQVNATVAGTRIAHAVANASPHGFAWRKGDPRPISWPIPTRSRRLSTASSWASRLRSTPAII